MSERNQLKILYSYLTMKHQEIKLLNITQLNWPVLQKVTKLNTQNQEKDLSLNQKQKPANFQKTMKMKIQSFLQNDQDTAMIKLMSMIHMINIGSSKRENI